MTSRSLIAGVCLWALTAFAAGSVDALRAHAAAARSQVVQLRSEQLEKRTELSKLSARIEALKAKRQNTILPGGELDGALKRSQELSGVLSSLAQRMAVSENELVASNTALLEGLSGQLAQARADFDRQTDRAARQALIGRMKQLRSERESVRAALPVTQVPSLDTLKPSDDPEELLEQAELLRDNEEKISRELKSIEGRLTERREENDLDRRVQRFLGEESMFDDQDRRLRLQRTSTLSAAESLISATGKASEIVPTAGGMSPATGIGAGAAASNAEFDGLQPRSGIDDSSIRVTQGSDARPQLGTKPSVSSRDGDDVASLEAQRVTLQRLVDELKAKAATLEKRASELK